MAEIINFPADVKKAAVEKIAAELKVFKGGYKETAVSTHIANMLSSFCEQEERFAQTVCKTKRTLSDCAKEILKSSGSAMSDLEVFRRAAQFYYPNVKVSFVMNLEITGDAPDEAYTNLEAKEEKKESAKKKETPKKVTSEKATVKETKAEKPKKKVKETMQLSLFDF
ncbi:MAG: Cas9 inhibitor AcrIIA9 family protein [Acutalibacteraceae bacterium]